MHPFFLAQDLYVQEADEALAVTGGDAAGFEGKRGKHSAFCIVAERLRRQA